MKINFLDEFEFFTGVPDSQLKPFCNYLMSKYGISRKHIIAANEGNACALAAGYHLATGKVPVVYLQNSGVGITLDPIASLMNNRVYGIPCVFVIGWRGQPDAYDTPQHILPGKATIKLLEAMDIESFIIDKTTTEDELRVQLEKFKVPLAKGKQVAFVVRKDAFEFDEMPKYDPVNNIKREEIISHITSVSGEDLIISTTGKASRELFEIRKLKCHSHCHDFLTIGSMGHNSSIGLGIALYRPDKKIWIIDGDGALLMHMGSIAVLGANSPKNIVHIVINNAAHETVGGMPTVAGKIDLVKIAEACGYPNTVCVDNFDSLDKELKKAKARDKLSFIEVKCDRGARDDLGELTRTPNETKKDFIEFLRK